MQHRNDIDGLRALAVLPILLFHAGVASLGGGFVGVDVFFVISGFLITTIILRELDGDRFSILEFYRRRVARIFPALFVMLGATLFAGCFFLLAGELRELARSVAAAGAFVANIFFWSTADYFAGAAEEKPLLHTWSLGVEEQFYLLYPLLLIMVRRVWPARLPLVLWLMTAGSFVASLALSRSDPTTAFYMLPSRTWELGLGAVIAVGAIPRLSSARARDVAALAGLASIALGVVLIRPDSQFPAPWALLPCLGAALLIAYGREAVTARLLAWTPLRWVGLISYSLYLWHWPIITFYRLRYGMALSPVETAGLVAASFAAALLSYFLVEQPFLRRLRSASSRPVVAGGAVALAAGTLGALALGSIAGSVARVPAEAEFVARYADYRDMPAYRAQFRRGTCFIGEGHRYDAAGCLAQSPTRRNVVLLGDSHAAQFWRALTLRFPELNIMQATASGCRPTVALAGAKRCTDVVDLVLNEVVNRPGVDGVVLSARWQERELESLSRTIRMLRRKGLPVTVIGPSVEYDGDFPQILARSIIHDDPKLVEEARLPAKAALDARMSTLVAAAGGRYFSAYQRECASGRCRLRDRNGGPFHFDYGHLTLAASREVLETLPAI